jgi:quinol monooxygenase YgiN
LETTDLEKFRNKSRHSVRCLAFFKAKKGNGITLKNILLGLVEPTRREQGNIAYVLHQSTEDPDEFVFDEIWTDMKSLHDHLQQQYIKSLPEKIEQLVLKPVEVKTYLEVID